MFSAVLLQNIRDVKRSSFTLENTLPAVIANLIFLHDTIVASEQLLLEAAALIDYLPSSLFNARLAQYYKSHLIEELDHVKWVREDLKSIGVNVPAALPNQLAMAMAGSQYYLLRHVHPAALLGYMAVLEGDPTPVEAIDALEQVYGKQLLRCARFHAVKDLEHRKELFTVIDETPVSLRGVIVYSAGNTLEYINQAARAWNDLEH